MHAELVGIYHLAKSLAVGLDPVCWGIAAAAAIGVDIAIGFMHERWRRRGLPR